MTNELVPYNGGVQVIQRHSVFDLHGRTAKVVEYRNQSIEDLFRDNIPLNVPCVCSLNGEVIPAEEWPLTMIAPNDCVLFTPILQGGGGNKGMQIIGALLIIVAIVLYATGYGAPIGVWMQGVGLGMITTNMVLFGMAVLGGALLMAGMVPSIEVNANATASLSSWSPQTTQAQGGCVPKYYGEHKLFGNIIATYIVDATIDTKEVQYLYVLVDLGMGPYESLSDFKINNIGINTLRQVLPIVRNGYLTQEIVPGFEKTHVTIAETQTLTYNVPVVRQTTGSNFDKLTIKTLFPAGLGYMLPDGNMDLMGVTLEVKVKRSVDSEWIYLAKQPTTSREVATPGQWILGWYDPMGGAWTVLEYGDTALASHREGDRDLNRDAIWHYTGTFEEVLGEANFKEIKAATRNRLPIDFVYEIPVNKHGQYDISVTRLSVFDERTNITNSVSYYGHVETEYDKFTYPRQVLVGIRALLTDQISGSFKFSCHAKASLIHVYDPIAQTWTPQWSNNPAWICYDILTSPVFYDAELNVTRATQNTAVARYDGTNPSRLDLDSFVAFAAFCDMQLLEGHGQTVAVVTGSAQKYKCIKTHLAADNLKPGVDYYVDKIPPTHEGLSGVGTISTNEDTIDYEGWRAFDHLTTTGWKATMEDGEAWIQFLFATPPAVSTPTRIRRYSVTWANGGEYADSWVFEGWDGAQWVELHSVSGFTGDVLQTTHTYTFTNNTGYDQYRLRITENTHDACLNELEMFDSDESWQTYWEATDTGDATTWSAGMRYYFGTESRYTFNGGFDTRSSRWNSAMQVCAVAQAALLTVGTRIFVSIDTIKTPSQLITEGNLISFKEQFLDLSNRATEVNAEFKNLEKDYESDNVIAFLSNDPSMFGKTDIKTFGLTKASEVWRISKYAVVQNQKRHVCEIEMDIDAIASMVGDVVYLQSETPDWEGSHGGIVLSATANTVTLDRAIVIAANKTYTIMIRLAATDRIVIKNISAAMQPGTYSTLTISEANWTSDPVTADTDPITGETHDHEGTNTVGTVPIFGDIFAFGEVDKVVKTFSIVNIVPTKTHGATLTLLEYDAELYTQVDNASPEIRVEDRIVFGHYVNIASLFLAEITAVDINGNMTVGIEATWVPSTEGPAYAKGKVYLRTSAPTNGLPGEWVLQTTTEDQTCIITNVLPLTSYDVMIVGVDTMGTVAPMNSPDNAIATIVLGDGTLPLITPTVTMLVDLISDQMVVSWNRMADVWIAGYALYLAPSPWNANITYALNISVSDAGIYYRSLQDANINHAVADTDWWVAIGTWSDATTYSIGTIIIASTVFYQSLQADNLNHLVSDVAWWVTIPSPGPIATITQSKDRLSYTYPATLLAGTYAFALRTVSQEGVVGTTDIATASLEITVPLAPPDIAGSTNGQTVFITWSDSKTSLSILHYVVNDTVRVLTPGYTEAVTWTGNKDFDVYAVDVAGNVSTLATATVNVESIVTGAVTSIVCIGKVYAIQLLLTYTWFDTFQAVEIWASATNTRAAAVLVGETTGTTYTHRGLPLLASRYYWTHIRKTDKTYGAWFRLSATEGVMGTVSSNPGDYFDELDIDESRLSKTLRTRLDWLDASPFVFTGDYCYPSTVAGMNGVFDTLAALATSHDNAISLARIDIDEGIAGEWASISLKAATATVTALDDRVSIAEIDIIAGKAGTWASILLKATTAALGDAVDRISSAELNIAAGVAGTWGSISLKATTSTVNGINARLAIAEATLTAADTWATVVTKLGVATYNTDQKDGNGYSRLSALENRFEVYDTTAAANWAGGIPYDPGNIVLCNGVAYRCLKVSENEWPPEHVLGIGPSWQEIDSGLLSQWTLKLTVNNHVAGVGLMLNDSGVSEFVILSNKFKIMLPNDTGDPISVFIAGTINGVSTVGIRGNLVLDGTLLANAISSGTISSKIITLAYVSGQGSVQICAGKNDFNNTQSGFCLGIDHADSKAKFYIGDDDEFLNWDGTNLVVGGDIIVGGNIKTDEIDTDHLKDHAISQSISDQGIGEAATTGNIWWFGGNVHITAMFYPVNGAENETTVYIKKDGTTLMWTGTWNNFLGLTCVDTLAAAGYHTYTAEMTGGGGISNIFLQIIEVMK